MSRAFVGQRKGAPPTDPEDATDGAADEGSEDSDVVTCPNCACQFNETTQDVVKPGLKVEGHDVHPQGKDLDVLDSAPPVPGKWGTAIDGSRGTQAMASLLNGLKGAT